MKRAFPPLPPYRGLGTRLLPSPPTLQRAELLAHPPLAPRVRIFARFIERLTIVDPGMVCTFSVQFVSFPAGPPSSPSQWLGCQTEARSCTLPPPPVMPFATQLLIGF